jgi:hypothetical protein
MVTASAYVGKDREVVAQVKKETGSDCAQASQGRRKAASTRSNHLNLAPSMSFTTLTSVVTHSPDLPSSFASSSAPVGRPGSTLRSCSLRRNDAAKFDGRTVARELEPPSPGSTSLLSSIACCMWTPLWLSSESSLGFGCVHWAALALSLLNLGQFKAGLHFRRFQIAATL